MPGGDQRSSDTHRGSVAARRHDLVSRGAPSGRDVGHLRGSAHHSDACHVTFGRKIAGVAGLAAVVYGRLGAPSAHALGRKR